MGIDNNSTVAISIVVKDDGSIALIDAAEGKLVKLQNVSVGAGSAVGKMASGFGLAGANLSTFGASIGSTTQGMAGFSNAAIKFGQDAQDAGEKTKGLNNHMREVSGTARELGLNMGYSLRRFLADSPAVMTALRGLEAGFVALGVIDIGIEAIAGVEKLYEKWFDVSKAVDEYQEKAAEAATQKLFDSGSLETGISLLKQAQGEVDRLNQKKEVAGANNPGGGFFQYAQYVPSGSNYEGFTPPPTHPTFSSKDDEALAQAQKNRDTALEHTQSLSSEFAEKRLRGEEAYDSAALKGYDAINARQRDGAALAQQHLAFTKEQEQMLQKIDEDTYALQKAQGIREEDRIKVYHADPNAGNAEYDSEVERLRQQASGQRVALSRQENDQIIQMQNAAIDAGVRGEALYDEQRQQAIDAVTRKFQQSEVSKQGALKETQAIDMKFHNEKMQRLQDEQYATLKIEQEAQQSGLKGIPRIQAETQSRVADLTQNPANAGLSQDDVQKRRVAYEQEGDQQTAEAHQQFNDKIAQMNASLDSQMTSGMARIAEQEKQALTERAKVYSDFYGDDQNKWAGYQDDKLRIEQNADRERQQYSRQINEQISQTEAQAARLTLPPWQAAQQQIADEYAQRLQKVRTEVQQHVITEEQGAREVNAAWQLANAQMQRQAEQSRDQIAGQLEQLFSDPSKYMQNRAKQMMMDIIANWVQQLEQSNPRMQGILGGLLGQNKMGVGSPRQGIMDMFGAHRAQPMSESLGMPQLDAAGSTLTSAGMTLSSSGTMLMNAAQQISVAASQMGVGNPMASGGFGGLGGSGGGWTGLQSSGSMGMPSYWGSGGTSDMGAAGLGGGSMSGGLGGAYSLASTVSPGGAGSTAAGVIGGIQQAMQLSSTLTQAFHPGGAPMLNPSGAFQPSDAAPTNGAGVMGTLPDSGSATSSQAQASGSTGGVAGAFGMAGGLISGGMGLFSAFEQGNNSKTFAGGLMGMATGAMSGAMLGTMFMPGIGTAIGAAAGAMVGLLGDIFGDHGRSKAKKYNINQIIPQLQQAMDGFSFGGSSYDSATAGINSLQGQAQQQTKQWGSGAWDYYKQVMIPEFQNAQQQVDREGAAGRSNVKMSAAQFDSGGVITSFGDMSTGPFSGFIHARMGERVMNPMASMTHASTLDAMNAGSAALSMMRRSAPLGGGGGGGQPLHVHIHTLDTKTMDHWARHGGAAWMREQINQASARYSGRALNAS